MLDYYCLCVSGGEIELIEQSLVIEISGGQITDAHLVIKYMDMGNTLWFCTECFGGVRQ